MTANLVKGFSPIQDIKLGAAAQVNQSSQTDFSQVLKNSTSNEGSKEAVTPKKVETTDKTESKPAEKVTDKDSKDANKVTKETKEEKTSEVKSEEPKKTDDGLSEESLEQVAEVVATMVNAIAEVLDIPVEDVMDAVDALGMQDIELLNPAKIPEVVVELTDASDMVEIMTDEELYTDVKSLMDTSEQLLSELSEETNIPVEELKTQINSEVAKLSSSTEKEVVVDTLDSGFEIINENPQDEAVRATADRSDAKQNDSKDNDHAGQENQALNFANSVIDNLKEAVSNVEANTPVSYSSVTQAEDIMNQITDSIRTTMKEEITEMEMQLHPASLGNVKVQIASRDGVITANFTTQNEEVRQALETQVVALKEQMNEQGIKVEAIEVTVSSHAFERNLNEEGERGQNQNEAEAKQKKVRSINLNGLSLDDIEDIDEEDRVTADMMARAGNTVDYLA